MTGVAETAVLKPGTQLFHGSPAGEFTHAYLEQAGPSPYHYEHPPQPDAPAWFATNILFSLHAAARFTPPNQQATFTLHVYQVTKQIELMSFQDMQDFAAFMDDQHQMKNVTINGVREATPLAKRALGSALDGYVVLKDVVRQEPEYVLFGSGLAKLGAPEKFTLSLVPVPGKQPPTSKVTFQNKPNDAPLATYVYGQGPGKMI